MTHARTPLALAALALAACFSPSYDNPTCGPGGACPAGFACVEATNVCAREGGDAIDAGDDVDTMVEPIDATEVPIDGNDGNVAVNLPYLPTSHEQPGSGAWTITTIVLIDTATLSSTGLPGGVTLDSTPQLSGPEVAVLHVGSVNIQAAGELRVTGTRVLAIVASGSVTINGVINASAGLSTPGPGAYTGASTGQGQPGTRIGNEDSGGGGAGHGTAGSPGGFGGGVAGGSAGQAYNQAQPIALLGGSRGGDGTVSGTCAAIGGGGGGGIYIYSPVGIVVNGRISVNGGGGGGGSVGACPGVAGTSGAGGGSGGEIDLQSESLTGSGFLTANGGAGGGGAGNVGTDGMTGQNGHNDATTAVGGISGASGSNGAAGGAGTTGPSIVGPAVGNGGGGGGAVGRVVVRYRGAIPTVPASPPFVVIAY